jgi:ABC-type glycerol-3-phosphate transport system substrate-binding protein
MRIEQSSIRRENSKAVFARMLPPRALSSDKIIRQSTIFNRWSNNYNKDNPGAEIQLIEYFTPGRYSAEEFDALLDAAMFDLELDIIRSCSPDILVARQPISLNRYARLGLFADLYPYLDADPAFDWADYYAHEIRAYEIDGKLYALPIGRITHTLLARQADIGDKTSWTLDEFIAFVDDFGSDGTVFEKPTKTAVLDLCLLANNGMVVGWNSDDVGFNRDFVAKVLNFANRFIDDAQYANDTFVDVRAQNGEIGVYAPHGYSGFPGTLSLYSELMGAPVSYIGYPSDNGSGYIAHSDRLVSLNANCQDKEAAWAFLSCYARENLLSRSKNAEYAESMKGQVVSNSQRRPNTSRDYMLRIGDNEIAAYLDLLEREVQIQTYDQTIDRIIKEAGSYFSGGKPLDEVLDVIENRIGVYVNESK